jgi:hypothetical protein
MSQYLAAAHKVNERKRLVPSVVPGNNDLRAGRTFSKIEKDYIPKK